ncbi:efflux RND transporter periplasmic adaptor subunit [Hyphomicrobium sp. 99]|uniref:efflux RND transporter periplasmic adaptor subunit n=1 Tax=Hyphomicrobium sp. 99 TaxID=1163419 RepID=UPI001FDA31EB|nr:efflux RND transporter periplasmic adaptor subunit [Hyphomicrobium sp. 99]
MADSNDTLSVRPPDERREKRGKPDVATPAPKGHGGLWLGLGVLLLLTGALVLGGINARALRQQTLATSERHANFVPKVRVAPVKASSDFNTVSLPATTLAFTTANIFARASGYIGKRNVDIGDRVKQGQLLAEIVAPELDHQIAQAQATLEQNKATLRQNVANRDLAKITWDRDKPVVAKGWVTQQQGSIDEQNLKALIAGVGVAEQSIAAQEATIKVLQQQKDYQSVVAPFDGVVTQRNIDVGSLVQADATSGTFMFNLQQTDIIRTQVYVPQDQAFGIQPGVEAVVRIPEIPDRTFPGKVTRIADALNPITRTLLTEIDVPNPDGAMSAGVYCTVELHIPRKEPSLLVPAEAIVFDRNGLHVAVVEDGIVHLQKVSVARDFGTVVEVHDGVKKGDLLVLNPPVDLAQGSKVEVRSDASDKTASEPALRPPTKNRT